MKMGIKTNGFAVVITTVLLLAACGGGGNSAPLGSVKNPIDLGVVSSLTRTDSMPAFGDLFYKFTPAVTAAYTISLTGITNSSSDLTWDVYGDPSFLKDLKDQCYPYSPYPGDDVICTTLSPLTAGTPYYLVVSEWNEQATTYGLTVQAQ